MATININTPGNGGLVYNTFLNSQLSTPRLCITSEEEEFDTETIRNWQYEGFEVNYLPLNEGGKEYAARLEAVKEGLRVGESYAIIAYGEAAAFCLDHFHKPATGARLTALVAYYPTAIPDTRIRFPPSLKVLVHLAGESVDVVVTPQALGIQGRKKRISTRRIDPGVGIGERKDISYTAFTYDFADPGFAEHDLNEYDHASAELAWSRTLDVMRKAFRKDADLERAWEINTESCLFGDSLSDTMSTYVTHKNPAVTVGPTLAGGVGAKALRRFYNQEFLGAKPPSMRLRLLSRTVGADRVVDEIYVTFDHTVEIPWMLPGVSPTNRRVEIILVAIIAFKADRIFTEHLYWDQASVLVQVGLLDPKLLPQGAPSSGSTKQLPVVGREAARRILGEHPARGEEYHRRLIANAKAAASKQTPNNRDSVSGAAANGKEVEQRKPGSINGATSSSASGSGSGSSKIKRDIADNNASGNESSATVASTMVRRPKKLGTPRKNGNNTPVKSGQTNGSGSTPNCQTSDDSKSPAAKQSPAAAARKMANGEHENKTNPPSETNGHKEDDENKEEKGEETKSNGTPNGENSPSTPTRPSLAARVESAQDE